MLDDKTAETARDLWSDVCASCTELDLAPLAAIELDYYDDLPDDKRLRRALHMLAGISIALHIDDTLLLVQQLGYLPNSPTASRR